VMPLLFYKGHSRWRHVHGKIRGARGAPQRPPRSWMPRLHALIGSTRCLARRSEVDAHDPWHAPQHLLAASILLTGPAAVLTAGALPSHHVVLSSRREPAQVSPCFGEPPELDWVHPYDCKPWYWKVMFSIRRGSFLFVVWIPYAVVWLAALLTGSNRLHRASLRYLVWTFEICGMTFQKFGQWMSMRPDIFSPQTIKALSMLCMSSRTHPWKATRQTFRNTFGCELEDVFLHVEETPLASGSVAQVYHAKLRPQYALPDGNCDVVIKVRHPGVLDESFLDISLIYAFSSFTRILSIPFQKEEFLSSLQKQLDLSCEARSMVKFAANFKAERAAGTVQFPTVCPQFSSSSVLVMSWAAGCPVCDIFSSVGGSGHGWDVLTDQTMSGVQLDEGLIELKRELAKTIFDINMKMYLRDNYIHGDMHGGNLLYSPSSKLVTVLDVGLTLSLDEPTSQAFRKFLRAVCLGDVPVLVSSLQAFNVSESTLLDYQLFETDIKKLVHRWVGKAAFPGQAPRAPDGGPVSVGDLMGGIFFVLQEHRLCLRGDIASTLCAIAIVEGLIRQLDPEFDMVNGAMKYLVRDQWSLL